jgi:asparagine synthase (glutamine-hydrolysing)
MCGIAGLAFAQGAAPPDPATLAAMSASIAHRGPDGAGSSTIGRIALLHRRLAIIDLAGGDQPLFAGNAALVAGGEIYNDLDLRAAMPDTRFATGSDCETPLHLWLAYGDTYAERLRGMYSIAIHDRAARSITLSRDPFGIKPLYVAQIPNGLAFASEPRAFLDSNLVGRFIRREARDELLQLQFTTGMETIFPGIERVLPGETLRAVDGHILERTRRPALPEGPTETIDEPAALARLDAALEESVRLHLRSEVGYGLFLSGGIDSAALLTMATRVGGPVRTFTARFDAPGASDESEQAAAIARACGAVHETLTIDEATVWRHLPEIVACMDDPVADYAIIPTWLLARRASRDVKVVLSGEGGDEIFAGYGRYRRAMRPWWLGGRPMRARGSFDGLGILRNEAGNWRDSTLASQGAAHSPGRSRLAAAQAADMTDWLPHDLLLKLDRCLMAHGIEGRTPYLDPGVAAAAFRLPDALKVQDNRGKYLLRTWLAANCPQARPFDRKRGFTVPVGAWIAAEGARLGALVARQDGVAEIARPDRVQALFRAANGKRERHAAWTLLFYALWHRTHVQGRPPQGDVFATLSAG